jgi:hypothetical protein
MDLSARATVKSKKVSAATAMIEACDGPSRSAARRASTTLTAQAEPKLFFMRPGFAISCIGHMAMLTIGLMFAGANPFESAPMDALTVEIVSPNEVETGVAEPQAVPAVTADNAPSFESAPSPQQPQPTPSFSSPPHATSPFDHPATPQALAPTQALPSLPSATPWFRPAPEPPPPAETSEFNPAELFGMPLAMPNGKLGDNFDAQAIERAGISSDDIAAFHHHLKTCSRLPAGVNVADNVKAVLRVFLKPDGTLAAPPQPIRIEGVSRGGGELYQSIVAAVRKCQPFSMLPRDKYDEWKVFDLSFTPQSFGGG